MATYDFGDARLDARGAELVGRIVETGSLVLRRIGAGRAGEVAAGRFLDSPSVTPAAIFAPHGARTRAAARGLRIVAAQDTTEINFSGRDRRRTGLGPGGDGKSLGFFMHALIAIDADHDDLLGVVDAHIWTRTDGKPAPRQSTPVEDKETMRWIDGMQAAKEGLAGAAQIVVVGDRESDFYAMLARVPDGIDLIARARHDRKLAACGDGLGSNGLGSDGLGSDGLGSEISGVVAGWPVLGCAAVKVAPRGPGDKGRLAHVQLKAGRITIPKPASRARSADPDTVTLGLVVAEEVDAPAGSKPLLWRLLTTLPTTTLADAVEIVRLYRLRWRIEQVFRALKSDGMALEETQVQTADRLFNLAALGLVAAARTLQLVDARDGSRRPATDVIEASLLAPAGAISATLEGKTERQKNTHEPGTLGWLAWIAARLGGWNCYYKPPGPKTMAAGWKRLAAMLDGYTIAATAAATSPKLRDV